MVRITTLLKRTGFNVTEFDNGQNERGFPSVTISIRPEEVVGMGRRLYDILRRNTIITREHSDSVWTPQIHVVYDPSADKAYMYLYGVSDDILPDI